jgi:YggT family protein
MLILAIISLLFWVYTIMLFVRILGSWFPEYQHYKFFLFIAFYTDPYLNLFRQLIPPLGMIDISPIIAFLCLGFIEQVLKAIVLMFVS